MEAMPCRLDRTGNRFTFTFAASYFVLPSRPQKPVALFHGDFGNNSYRALLSYAARLGAARTLRREGSAAVALDSTVHQSKLQGYSFFYFWPSDGQARAMYTRHCGAMRTALTHASAVKGLSKGWFYVLGGPIALSKFFPSCAFVISSSAFIEKDGQIAHSSHSGQLPARAATIPVR